MNNLFYFLAATIIMSFNTFFIGYNYNKTLCISLVIPSTNFSWNKCKAQIEHMLCNSVEFPREAIIVISGSNYDGNEYYLTYCKYKIDIYYRTKKHNSASNKNYGSKYAKCSYISFFDADDIMSNVRIRIIHNIIQNYRNYDIILHMYTKNYKALSKNINYKNITNYFYLNSSYITYLYKTNIQNHNVQLWGCCHFLPTKYHISNGWVTVKRSMFKYEKFDENKSIERAEDSEYNGRVISKGYKALILTLILGYYSKQNMCNINGNLFM